MHAVKYRVIVADPSVTILTHDRQFCVKNLRTGFYENSTYVLVGTVSQKDGQTDGPHKALYFLLDK